MVADRLHQRREQGGRSADPAGQRGAIKIDAFAGIDLRLPVQWNVVASTSPSAHAQATRIRRRSAGWAAMVPALQPPSRTACS